MTRRNLILLCLAFGLVVILFMGIVRILRGPEGIVLKRMDQLAEVVSMKEFKALDAIRDAQDFLKFFTDPVSIETKYGEFNATHDVESLKNHFLSGRGSAKTILLEFKNSQAEARDSKYVTVQTDAYLSADLKRADPIEYEQTVIFHWKKEEGKWKIHKVIPSENPDE